MHVFGSYAGFLNYLDCHQISMSVPCTSFLQVTELPTCPAQSTSTFQNKHKFVVVKEFWHWPNRSGVPLNYRHHQVTWTFLYRNQTWKWSLLMDKEWREYSENNVGICVIKFNFLFKRTKSHHCTWLFLSCSYEAEAVRRCLVDGKTECETIPLDESLIIAETMDSILEQLGVKY